MFLQLKKYLVLCLALPLTAFAQKENGGNGLLRLIDKITNSDRLLVPVPIFQRVPETGWNGGIGFDYYFRAKVSDSSFVPRPSYLFGYGTYSQFNQLQLMLDAQIFTRNENYFIKSTVGYVDFYDRFWGIGNLTPEENLSEYYFSRWSASLRVLRKIRPNIFAGINAGWRKYFQVDWFQLTPAIDLDAIPGSRNNAISGAGPSLTFDFRDSPYSPLKGWYADVSAFFSGKSLGSDFAFQRYSIDARKYIPLGKNWVLAGMASLNHTAGDVPFRELSRLGGPFIMRGFFSGRYKDRNLLAFQTELRAPLGKWFTFAVFGSSGRVSPTLSEMVSGVWKHSYGGGPRLLLSKKQRIYVRLDYARTSTGEAEFYFRFFDAF